MEIRPVGEELFHTEGQTDMTKLTLFANLRKAPKKREDNYELTE